MNVKSLIVYQGGNKPVTFSCTLIIRNIASFSNNTSLAVEREMAVFTHEIAE